MKQWMTAFCIALLAILAAGGYQYFGGGSADAGPGRAKRVSNVNVVKPVEDQVRDVVVAVGTLQAQRAIELTSEVNGRIVELNFEPGEPVAKGQLLVRLDDRQARADLRVAQAQYDDARRQYDRARSLQARNSISQSQVDELRTAMEVADAQRASAQTRLEDHRIEAPFAGVAGLRDVTVGAYLNEGDSIATLDAIDQLDLTFSIPERYLGQISRGQHLTALTSAFPDQPFDGTLTELGTRVNELSRALPVKALVANPDRKLRPGQYMSVNLTLRQRRALVIPEQAVLVQGNNAYVFVADQNAARRVEVTLGARKPGIVEVVSGVSADDSVIVTGQDRLSSGDAIQVVEGDDVLLSGDASRFKGS